MYRRSIYRWAGILACFLIGVEFGARLDDLCTFDTPFLSTPSREHDLTQAEPWGLRGRSHGRYRKWKLNEFGFRGPEIQRTPPAGTTRIVVLGSSESFGLYEDEGNEYAALLDKKLRLQGKFEVINASMAGMALNRTIPFWDNWVSQFKPKDVLLYSNPIFYLREEPPELKTRPNLAGQSTPPHFGLRLTDRVSSTFRTLPLWVRKLNRERQLRDLLADKPTDWVFQTAPLDRLDIYRSHMIETLRRIRADGSRPILVTYAIGAAFPPRQEDALFLEDMQTHFPRSTLFALSAFHKMANEALRELANEFGVPLIDADQRLSGRAGLFADLVHFTNRGSEEIAQLLAEELLRLYSPSPKTTNPS